MTPKLCASSSECVSSIGRDYAPRLLGRWYAPKLWRVEPEVDANLGYEWFSSRLTSGTAVSSRAFHGPFLGIEAHGMFPISQRLRIGVTTGVSGGTFVRSSLAAPGVDVSRPAEGRMLHVWPMLGVRLALRLP